MSTNKKYKLHVVSHTHWDREWYLSYQVFRMKLVEMIDELLDLMEKDKNYKYFTLDGQTVVLKDYLEIRPENEKRLKKFIKEGRILAGPFYILPDEFLVSGESMIRNLMLGSRIAGEFGNVMKIGYLPDPFGHISQMPQILKGFGIDNFFFMRGYDGGKSGKSEFWWDAPDGSRALAVWMPYGYCNAVHLPENEREAENRLTDIKEKLIPHASTRHLLAMNGCDHVNPERHLSGLLGNLNGTLKDVELVHSTLEKYVQAVKTAGPGLETVRGEFRVQKASQWLLTGVLSSRIPLKQANRKAQDSLERWAEPYSAIAWLLGAEYPHPFIWKSWEYLLQNHPHDSICGCSIDHVHREMESRFDSSLEISETITHKALEHIGRKVKLPLTLPGGFSRASRGEEKGGGEKGLLVFNPLPWEREDLVGASLTFHPEEKVENFRILDAGGKEMPYALIDKFDRDSCNHWNAADGYNVQFLSRAPAFGYNSYKVVAGKPAPSKGKYLVNAHGVMENEYLKVGIQPDGSLKLFDKENNQHYSGLNVFEDGGDAGDEYNYSYPARDRTLNTRGGRAEIKLLADTPLFASYRINVKLSIPCGLTPDRKSRSEKTLKHYISSDVTLWRGAKRLDVVTGINNNAEDHRLRVLFPSRAKTEVSAASGKFDVLYRPVKSEPKGKYAEEPSRTHPHDGWVMAQDKNRGIMVAAQGLLEYELKEDKERTIALTLLRSVGWLSRHDLLTRDDNAGPSAPTPDAQCPGNHVFHYAIIPAGKGKSPGGLQRQAYQHNIPMGSLQIQKNGTGGTLPPVDRKVYPVDKTLPLTESFISLEPEEMILTSVKKAEDAGGIIVRFFNSGDKDKNAILNLFKSPKKANLVNLNETPIKKIQVSGNGAIKVKAKKKEIVTVRLDYPLTPTHCYSHGCPAPSRGEDKGGGDY